MYRLLATVWVVGCTLGLLGSPGHGQIIPPERRIDWQPGMDGEFPAKEVIVDVLEYGAVGDGIADDTQAFQDAIASLPSGGGELYVPAGSYLLTSSLRIEKGVLIRGDGHQQTRLLFDLDGRGDNCIDFVKYDRGDWMDVWEGYDKGSQYLLVERATAFAVGDVMELQQDNDPALMYTDDNWNQSWSENAVGQLLRVTDVRGDTVFFSRPLYMDYRDDLRPQARKLGMIEFPGIEDLYIERLDAGDGHTIQMRYVTNGRVQRIESNMTYRTHMYLSESMNCLIRRNYVHHSHDYGGGGHGYGVDVIRHSTDNLIINNVFEHLRHSMMTHVGSSGNVFAYNYSHDREPQKLCDISVHGHYPNFNLFESNRVHEIDIADYWGPAGPGNTYFRNRVVSEGIEVADASHQQNIVGNIILRTLDVRSGVDHTLRHGNVVRNMVQWDDEIGTTELPASYFLDEKPDFLAAAPWPLYGPDVDSEFKLPAQVRFESGNPVTRVQQWVTHQPSDFTVSVFPNPFNPATHIQFNLAKTGRTSISVYNIRGQFIKNLLNKRLDPGAYAIPFEPSSSLPSGVYLLRIVSDNTDLVRKITLMR